MKNVRLNKRITPVLNSGFTLAEVLITLGIIGVVAAMTIPNLITAHQKRVTATKLQKAISVLNQAYKMSYDDVGDPTAEEAFKMGGDAYIKKYWFPYIKVANYCKSFKDCGFKSNKDSEIYDLNRDYRGTRNFTNRTVSFSTMDNYIYTFHLASSRLKPDGTAEIFPDPAVFVDINGVNKPNLLGKDIFLLDRFSDGNGIQPRCHNNSNSYVDVNCSKNNSRTNVDCCAEKIRRAGWVIDKSYPWH